MRQGDDKDVCNDFATAYNEASSHWLQFTNEAKKDMAYFLGDQWDRQDRAYLAQERRNAFVFNKIRRVVKLITGYQRKTRLSLKAEPVEGGDSDTADMLTAALIWQMQSGSFYNVMSDAFEFGACVSGINLVSLYMDYSRDPIDGDIKLQRLPFNRFLVDPSFTDQTLSNAAYVLGRQYLTKDALTAILPKKGREALKDIKPGSWNFDGRYSDGQTPYGLAPRNLYTYDEYYRRTTEPYTVIFDTRTGESMPYQGDKARLADIMALMPWIEKYEGVRGTVELHILVEGQPVYTGPDPLGIGDYPHVPVLGFYVPEYEDPAYRLQGIVRCLRDPQTEINKRRSQMQDIIASQITTGWKAKDGSVINRDALYGAGQGKVIWIDKASQLSDIERNAPVDIPPGLFQLVGEMDNDLMEIAGANSELMGMAEGNDLQVAGVLAKLRQAAGLTILQDMFDNYRLSKRLLGIKTIRAMQANYGPEKMQRITGKGAVSGWDKTDLTQFDVTLGETPLTDSQRNLAYSQLIQMKEKGAPIPWSIILDLAPICYKAEVKKAIEAEEKAQAEQMNAANEAAMRASKLGEASILSDIEANKAKAAQNRAGAIENMADIEQSKAAATLDLVKALMEIKGMNVDQITKLATTLQQMTQPHGAPNA